MWLFTFLNFFLLHFFSCGSHILLPVFVLFLSNAIEKPTRGNLSPHLFFHISVSDHDVDVDY